jgi:hypothetical protein
LTAPLVFFVMYLYIKSKKRNPGEFPRTGVIIEPDLLGVVHSDEELYDALAKVSLIQIAIFKDNNPLEIGEIKYLSFSEFERDWRGD